LYLLLQLLGSESTLLDVHCPVDVGQRISVDQAPTKVDPDDNITPVKDLGPPDKQRAEYQADSARCQPSCAAVTY